MKRKNVSFIDWVIVDGYFYFVPKDTDAICRCPVGSANVEVVKTIDFDQNSDSYRYSNVFQDGSNILFVPLGEGNIIDFNLLENSIENVSFELSEYYKKDLDNHSRRFIEFYKIDHFVYMFGYGCPLIVKYDCNTKDYDVISGFSEADSYSNFAFGITKIGNFLYGALVEKNGLIRLDTNKSTIVFIPFDYHIDSIDGIAEYDGNILVLGKKDGILGLFEFDIEGKCKKITKIGNIENNNYYFEPIIIDKYIYIIAMGVGTNYVIDIESHEMEVFHGFPKDIYIVAAKKMGACLCVVTEEGNYYECNILSGQNKVMHLIYAKEDEEKMISHERNMIKCQLSEKGVVPENDVWGCKDFILYV